jgi:hypothetical protein
LRVPIVNVVRALFLRGWDLLHYLSRDGSWRLSAHERVVAEAAIRSFPEDIQRLQSAQLQQRYFVERIPKGRINVLRYYSPDEALRIEDPRFSDMLVVVRVAVDGREQNAHITFSEGYLFSIEFRKEAAFYAGRSLEIRDVKIGNRAQSYTRAIDRLEHGSDSE